MSARTEPIKTPPAIAMLQMIQGFWASRALYAAAKLGIADVLKDGTKNCDELAQATGAHPGSLYRLMRALGRVGIFAEDEGRRFRLTPLGETLRTDAPDGMRFFVIESLGGNTYRAWEKVLYSIETGKIAFDRVHGVSKWEYLAGHPEESRNFDAAMSSVTSVIVPAVVAACDFSSCGTVVDVGGGDGTFVAAVLKANPKLRGILADLPHVAERAQQRLATEGLAQRCEVTGRNFLESVPKGDTYLLKWIIHDWDDERSVAILKNCRREMNHNGRVLLIEAVLQPGTTVPLSNLVDLVMLVMTGGRERTEPEYRALLGAADLRLARVIPTRTEQSVIEALPA